ncbi:MAG: AEC family transporter [Clostridiaceae bacterium]|nr:AEC family transporter [Clostridiaceae bacterium]
MGTFIYIITSIIFPIFFLIAAGFAIQKKFKMDTKTLTRLNLYLFIPAVLFLKIYETKVTFDFFAQVIVFVIVIQAAMILIGNLISKVLGYSRSVKKAFCNSLLFFNSGNYGLPLVDLVFNGDPVAVASQIFVMLVQNITTNTYGVFQASSGNSTTRTALKNILKMPSIYVISAIILIKSLGITLPGQVLIPLEYFSRGYISLALVTLGAQLAEIKIEIKARDIMASAVTRLIISPLLGFFLLQAMGIKSILAQALVIGVSTPSAVNSALIAKEFDNEPEYASQVVFVSTILSALTITIVIYLVRTFL